MLPLLFSVMLLASDAAATAPATEVAAEPATQPAEAPKAERKICKSEQVSGSIRAKRVCLTASQWRARAGRDGSEDLYGVSTK
jgi:hypothetical protein